MGNLNLTISIEQIREKRPRKGVFGKMSKMCYNSQVYLPRAGQDRSIYGNFKQHCASDRCGQYPAQRAGGHHPGSDRPRAYHREARLRQLAESQPEKVGREPEKSGHQGGAAVRLCDREKCDRHGPGDRRDAASAHRRVRRICHRFERLGLHAAFDRAA